MATFPLDLQREPYTYLERPNAVLVELLDKHVLAAHPASRILDVGCGCGANARAVHQLASGVHVTGIEPSERAAALARASCDEVFVGDVAGWLRENHAARYDAVVLSDVLEHIADPVAFLRELARAEAVAGATWVISVPNYAVWYNRVRTALGRFSYQWSGLFDRTHLRFYTRKSIHDLLAYCGFEVVVDRVTPALVQSAAPILRGMFEADVTSGNHLALGDSAAYRIYERAVQPIETRVCQLWPELLGFQIVSVARVPSRPLAADR